MKYKQLIIAILVIIAVVIIGYFYNSSQKLTNLTEESNDEMISEINSTGSNNKKIELILGKFKSKDDILSERKSKYFDEVNKIDSYYTDSAFYEYYLLLSAKNENIDECNKIKEDKEKNLCKDLFTNRENKENFFKIYKRFWEEDENFIVSMFQIYHSILDNKCIAENVIVYLDCKKILDKSVDVKEIFMNYSILKFSNLSLWKQYYKRLSDYWGYDDWFISLLENTLYKE